FTTPLHLLSYAEPAEDAVEDVVGDDGADDLPQLVEGLADVDGDELIAAALEQGCRTLFERLAGADEAGAAAGGGACREIVRGRPCVERGGNGRAQGRQPRASRGAGRQQAHPRGRSWFGQVALGPDVKAGTIRGQRGILARGISVGRMTREQQVGL